MRPRLIEFGVKTLTGFYVSGFDGASATLSGRYAGQARELEVATLAVVGARAPEDAFYMDEALPSIIETASGCGIAVSVLTDQVSGGVRR